MADGALGGALAQRKEFIEINDLETYQRCRVQLHAQGIVLRDQVQETLGKETMSKKKPSVPLADYSFRLGQIKDRIRQSEGRAVLAVNAELDRLYWDMGRLLDAKQRDEDQRRRSFHAWLGTF